METLCTELLEKIFSHVNDEVDKLSLMYVNKRFFSILSNDKNFRNKICLYAAKEGYFELTIFSSTTSLNAKTTLQVVAFYQIEDPRC
jgi:hypothetical protein